SSGKMKESLYDLLCAVMLGVGNLCMFLGYDSQTTIVEPVLHSVHDRLPELIDLHAGYNGTGVCLVMFMVLSLTAPWTLGLLGSKGSILLGSLMFSIHLSSFFYVHYIPYYTTQAMIGLGYSLFYSGHGTYTAEHSTSRTIGRNSSLTYALATSSLIAGGCVILLTSRPSEIIAVDLLNATVGVAEKSYRQYSDSEIRMMYGSFAAVALVSNIIFAFLPTRAVENSLALVKDRKERIGLKEQLVSVFSILIEKRMLLAAPIYYFLGFITAFWISIYPATLIYSKKLSENGNLQAYYIIAVGFGEIAMGSIISISSKYIRNFAKMPAMIIGSILYFTAMTIALLSTPFTATHTPTAEPTLFLEPSMHLALLIAFLLGMADSALVTSRTVLCSLLIPDKISHVFSISKVHQVTSLAMSSPLFLSAFMSMPVHFVVNLIFGIVA
ncbi:hypothetical protein PENTCL1PPCAC_15907, partial [Pristionchus entomophagus]